jgi:putative transposase
MNEMNNYVPEEQRRELVAEFRLSVVAELANPYLNHGELIAAIREKASRTYEVPFSKKTTITEGCIKKWLALYRRYGKAGLLPKVRADKGSSRMLPESERDAFLEYLTDHPELTARAVYRILYDEGAIKTVISSSSLSRLVQSAGLAREQRLRAKAQEQTRKFAFFYPLECVQADCMHGPMVPMPSGKHQKAILLAFIDDATRRIVYATFSTTERSLVFEQGLKHILTTHGRIGRVYVDNGSTFVSNQTQRILDTLQVLLIHSKPARPQGRGKIERFFRTVREMFLRPLDEESIKSMEDLNARFHTWLESEYHRSPHRGLDGSTPVEAWLAKAKHIITIDPTVDLDDVFFHEITRKVHKDSTITVNGTLYEVPSILIGSTVKLRFDPRIPNAPRYVSCDGTEHGEARVVDTYANTKVSRAHRHRDHVEQNAGSEHANITASLQAARFQTGGA